VSADDSGNAAGPGGAASDVAEKDRAAELLLWYPRAWRDRYGEEFAELLIADIGAAVAGVPGPPPGVT
jgi:hypothetical protein